MSQKVKMIIVTPSYNQGKYIEQTIKSIVNQKYSSFKYYVFDGKSLDNTINIIKKYSDKIDYWVSKKDNGQSYAINEGWRKASDDIDVFAWLNSDDYYEPDIFEYVIKAFSDNPDASIVCGDCRIVSENGADLGILKGESKSFKRLSINGQKGVWQPAAFFNAGHVRACNLLNEKLHYCMDYDLILKLVKKGKIIYINKVLANHRMYSDNKSVSQSVAHWREKLLVRKMHLGHVPLSSRINYYKFRIFNALPEWMHYTFRSLRRTPYDKANYR